MGRRRQFTQPRGAEIFLRFKLNLTHFKFGRSLFVVEMLAKIHEKTQLSRIYVDNRSRGNIRDTAI